MSIQSFMRSYRSGTVLNHLQDKSEERIYKYSAAIMLSEHPYSPDDGLRVVELGRIYSFVRGKGHGSDALRWLCKLADKHGVALCGSIEPLGFVKPKLDREKLAAWYTRYGFEVSTVDWYMYRAPVQRPVENLSTTRKLLITK